MTIQYASDLHLEFPLQEAFLEKNPLRAKGNILLLAGDITYLKEEYYEKPYFDQWSGDFDRVFIVPGNHEFYRKYFPVAQVFPSMHKKIRENVHYVNNHVEVIGDVRLVFTTLFSAISPQRAALIQTYLNDFHISNYLENLTLTVEHYNRSHQACKRFLEETLSIPFDGKTLVVSHHAPYPKTAIEGPKFPLDLSEAFHVDMTGFVEKYLVDHWISGHTHINHAPIHIAHTTFHTNQMGYIKAGEHRSFRWDAVIEV